MNTMNPQNPITDLYDPRVSIAIRTMILAAILKGWWWDKTLSPFKGCTPVSRGCANCWAIKDILERMFYNPSSPYVDGARPTFHPGVLDAFAEDLQPKRIFTPSMGDPYHEAFTDEQIVAYHDAMAAAPWHYYFSLTSRADRLAEIGPYIEWPDHVLAVVSVEDAASLDRIGLAYDSGAPHVGASFEPVVDRIPLRSAYGRDLVRGLDYAIVGGETGENGKIDRMRPEHARELVEVSLEEAKKILAQPKTRGRRSAANAEPLKTLGEDPVSGSPIQVKEGRWGPYVTDGETNASLRKGDSIEEITTERAADLLQMRRDRGPVKKKRATKKKTTKKTSKKKAKKKTSKKAKKKTSKKKAKKKTSKKADG